MNFNFTTNNWLDLYIDQLIGTVLVLHIMQKQ